MFVIFIRGRSFPSIKVVSCWEGKLETWSMEIALQIYETEG